MSALQQTLLAGKYTPPTYATWSPTDKNLGVNLSSGNLVADGTSNVHQGGRATIGKSSGKWYWEILITENNAGDLQTLGIANVSWTVNPAGSIVGQDVNSYGYIWSGQKAYNSISIGIQAYGASYDNGDRIGIALDLDGGTITFYKNNVSQGVAFTGISGTFLPAYTVNVQGTVSRVTANFGATAFTYSPPSGYNPGFYN